MKALLKIMTIALVLNFMLIDIAGARPKAPGGSVFIWCEQNQGVYSYYGGGQNYCEECEFGDFAGKTDLYTCCEYEGTRSCGWKQCFRATSPSAPGGQRVCGAAKTSDLVPNLLLELLRSAERKVPAQPDLVPLPTPASMPPAGFCRRNDQGKLLVKIYNQGGSEAAATKTRVQFGSAAPTDFDTPAIAAASSTELVIAIPNACYDANNNCAFTIGADATATAAESNEINNNAAGLCGPQFF